jgi:2-dehydropantoate 2-reductase
MRFVIYGAGAIGGVVGARLHQAGHEVVLIARGAHLQAIKQHGLVLETPEESVTLRIPATDDLATVSWAEPATVILSVKSQDTEAALGSLEASAPPGLPVVCAQNGVENERRVLRRFANTYGMVVMCPASHLRPGVVQAHSLPVTGLMDLGRYPEGVDSPANDLAAAFRDSTFDANAIGDVMRWKYRKLLMNLNNAVDALCGPEGRGSKLAKAAYLEGKAVLDAAGVPYASREEDAARRGNLLTPRATVGGTWSGGSSWQSLARQTGSVEADFLNGEITLLGRLHGQPTPVNDLLGHRVQEEALRRAPPGTADPDELLAEAGLA